MIVLDCSRQSTSLWEYAFVVSYYLLSRHLRKGFLDLGVRLVILIKCAKFHIVRIENHEKLKRLRNRRALNAMKIFHLKDSVDIESAEWFQDPPSTKYVSFPLYIHSISVTV